MSRFVIAIGLLFAGRVLAEPVTLAQSAALAIDVAAATTAWCGPAPAFEVTAPNAATFVTPEFATLVKRLGTDLVAVQCQQAQRLQLRGLVRSGSTAPVWLGTAEASSGWALSVERPPPLDLDAPGAARAAPAISAETPTPLGTVGRAKAEAALGSLPGHWNPARRCWAAVARQTGDPAPITGCIAIVKGFIVPAETGAHVHLLLEGRGSSDCHACAGLLTVAVVAAHGDDWHALGRPVIRPSGAYGQATDPNSIQFVRLGAMRWGWIEAQNFFGQGYLDGGMHVHLMRDGVDVDAGDLPGDHSNVGACDDVAPALAGCERKIDYTVAAVPDTSSPNAPAYPLILHAHGTLGGPLDKTVRVSFDERKGQYVAPDGWP